MSALERFRLVVEALPGGEGFAIAGRCFPNLDSLRAWLVADALLPSGDGPAESVEIRWGGVPAPGRPAAVQVCVRRRGGL